MAAPLALLASMVILRVHLDDADGQNGCLRVIPGSHLLGRLSSVQILAKTNDCVVRECEVKGGDVMKMRPLLLHSSRKSTLPSHRRVIHVDCVPRHWLKEYAFAEVQ